MRAGAGILHAGCGAPGQFRDRLDGGAAAVGRRQPRAVAMVADAARSSAERADRACDPEQSRPQDRARSLAAGAAATGRARRAAASAGQWRCRRRHRHGHRRNQGAGGAPPVRNGENNTGLKKISGAGGLDAEWEIDIFGKIASRIEAQVYTAEALKEARDWVYVVVAADVTRLYFDLRARQDRLQILYRNIEASRKVLDLAQTRLDRGLTNELDVLLAKRQVETLQADVEPLKAQ